MNIRIALLPAVMALALCACNNSANDTASTPTPAATAAPAATPAPPPAAPATAAAPASASTAMAAGATSADKTGIPDCDDYISKVQACVANKVPEAQRAMMESAFKQQSDAFKQAAANPATKDALAAQCKQALAQAKATYTSFGCSL